MIFNSTADRDPRILLQPFISDLDLVIFCTNTSKKTATVDQENFTTTDKMQLKRCEEQLHVWTKLQASSQEEPASQLLGNTTCLPPTNNPVPGIIIPCINDALLWISQGSDPNLSADYYCIPSNPLPQDLLEADQVQVLVTGSLHLVGGVIACIKPEGVLAAKKASPELLASYYNLLPQHRANSIPGMT